jgi:hypothetical protein
MLLENMVLKITSVLVSVRRIIQARHKDLVKVTVKFIRKGIRLQQTESRLSLEREQKGEKERDVFYSPRKKWEQKLKVVVPDS